MCREPKKQRGMGESNVRKKERERKYILEGFKKDIIGPISFLFSFILFNRRADFEYYCKIYVFIYSILNFMEIREEL